MKKLLLTLCVAMVAGTAFATVPVLDQYLPALGHAFGAAVNGVQPWWRGDVWVFNPSTTQSATVDIYLLLRQANPNPDSRRITVNPGDTVYLPDVIFNTFGADNTFAGLRFVSSTPVVVTGESYDANVTVVSKGQGTAGQFFAGLPADYAIGTGESTDLPGFDQDGTGTSGTFRSNLAVVETTGNPVTYTVSIYNGAGTLVGTPKDYNLDVRQVGQINTVITDVTGTTGTNERVHVAVKSGTGQIVAVGSRIDNRTGDPSTIDMVAFHRFGLIEGVVFDVTGQLVDGGLQLSISDSAITNYDVLTGIPCGTDEYTLDFGPKSGTVTIGPDGTFSTSVTYDYTDPLPPNATLFTTVWTLAGARAGDGTWSGTVRSDTSGGTGTYAPCNQTNVMRPWRASWTTGTQ